MPKTRLDLYLEDETAQLIEGAVAEFNKRHAAVVDDLARVYGADLLALYREQRAAELKRRAG